MLNMIQKQKLMKKIYQKNKIKTDKKDLFQKIPDKKDLSEKKI